MTPALFGLALLISVVELGAIAVPALARAGLVSCDEPSDIIPGKRLMVASILGGALPGGLALMMGHPLVAVALVSVLGAVLLVAAYVDRETGWAPDHLLAPFSFAGFTLAGLTGSWGITLWQGVLAGIFVYPVLMGIWIGVRALTPSARLMPPNDLLSLVVPCVMLGPDLSMGYLVSVAVLLVLVRISPFLHKVFLRADVAERMVADMGLDAAQAQSFVTLLVVTLPVSFAFMLVRIFFMEGF